MHYKQSLKQIAASALMCIGEFYIVIVPWEKFFVPFLGAQLASCRLSRVNLWPADMSATSASEAQKQVHKWQKDVQYHSSSCQGWRKVTAQNLLLNWLKSVVASYEHQFNRI